MMIKKENRSAVVTSRVPTNVKKELIELAARLGLTLNELMNMLIVDAKEIMENNIHKLIAENGNFNMELEKVTIMLEEAKKSNNEKRESLKQEVFALAESKVNEFIIEQRDLLL